MMEAAAAVVEEVGDHDVQREVVDGADVGEQQNIDAWVLPPDDERASWEVGVFTIYTD